MGARVYYKAPYWCVVRDIADGVQYWNGKRISWQTELRLASKYYIKDSAFQAVGSANFYTKLAAAEAGKDGK
jgi:hypothetical protein